MGLLILILECIILIGALCCKNCFLNRPSVLVYLFLINVDHARAKLNPNRQIVNGLKPLVGELQQQTRLADARVADYDVFEEVRVTHH